MSNKLETFERGAADALKHFREYHALRYSFPIGPRHVVLRVAIDGRRARGTWDKQVYTAATIEAVIDRIREDIA